MEFFKTIVELIKAVAWPSAFFALGFMFRSDVRGLFPRLTKANLTGLEFNPTKQASSPQSGLRDLPGYVPPSAAVASIEASIRNDLAVIDPDKQQDLLIRHLAVARLGRSFEQTYRIIFGSQIAALKALEATSSGTTSRKEAEDYFEGVKARFPDFYEKSTFDEWVRYPIVVGLIEEIADQIKLTAMGRDFIRYIDDTKLPADKPW